MSEKNELVEAALKLAEIISDYDFETIPEDECDQMRKAISIIERHRPKPNRLEGWLELNRRGLFEYYHKTEPNEFVLARIKEEGGTVHHLREVVPVEFEKWTGDGQNVIASDGTYLFTTHSNATASRITELHNAEMERIANA
jgi:hypothetical protein